MLWFFFLNGVPLVCGSQAFLSSQQPCMLLVVIRPCYFFLVKRIHILTTTLSFLFKSTPFHKVGKSSRLRSEASSPHHVFANLIPPTSLSCSRPLSIHTPSSFSCLIIRSPRPLRHCLTKTLISHLTHTSFLRARHHYCVEYAFTPSVYCSGAVLLW